MRKGACNCGAIQYEIAHHITDIYQCHCSICRRASGVHGMTVLVVDKADFHWICGQDDIRRWAKSGQDWENCFCPICGGGVPGENDPTRMFIPVGALDDQSGLSVAHHIFVDSKAPWHVIADRGQQHPDRFGSGAAATDG